MRPAPNSKLSEFLIVAAVGAMLGYAAVAPVSAQGLLQRLFDPPVNAPAPAVNQPRVVTIPAVADKNEDAARLLVVGDFMARGVADALVDAFADEPSLIVVDRTNGSSGIVRDDFYDWISLLPGIIRETEPAYIVMMIGTNDRQTLRTNGAFELRSADWDQLYGERVAALAEAMAPFGPNALWVGQPPMRGRSMSGDMAYFNTVYEAAVDQYGLTFIDIWDAFADQDGRFATTGPDVEGRDRLLR
ncbi:MAG: SGNH/GDSL hydrolase family protein, partial [Alphaproteobacteria bacterium]